MNLTDSDSSFAVRGSGCSGNLNFYDSNFEACDQDSLEMLHEIGILWVNTFVDNVVIRN